MSVCEKCWAAAGGNMERYTQLLNERKDNPCTPGQQTGQRKYMNTQIQNATAEHLRDVATEFDRTAGSFNQFQDVLGALRTGANEIDRLQQQLTDVLSKVAGPINYGA